MDAKTGKRIHPVFVYMMSKVQSCSCTKICICIWQMYNHRAVKRDGRQAE